MTQADAIPVCLLELDSGRLFLDLVLVLFLAAYLITYLLPFLKKNRATAVQKIPPPAPPLPVLDLIDDLADAVLGIDSQDHILFCSKRAEDVFGFSQQELMMRNYQSLLILPEGFDEYSAHPLTGAGKQIGLEHQAWGLRKNGKRFSAKVSVTPCRKENICAIVAVREAPPPENTSLPQDGIHPDRLLPTAKRIRKLSHLIGRSQDISRFDRELIHALQESTDNLFAEINLFQSLKAIEDGSIKTDIQPLHLGQWLQKESVPYQDLARKRGCHLVIPDLKDSNLVVLTDEEILSQIYQALLDFSLTKYNSPVVNFHVTQNLSQRNPSSTSLGLLHNRILTGGDTTVRFILIASAHPANSSPSKDNKSLIKSVELDPHIQLARQLLPLVGADLAIDANEYSGLLFQFSISCQSIGSNKVPSLPDQPEQTNQPHKADQTDRLVLSITEDAELKQWIREILVAEGFYVDECSPNQAIETIRDGKPVDLVVLQRELTTETDFDLTYEMRQYRSDEDLPILLVHTGDHADPKISYFNAQDSLNFPADVAVLKNKVSALCKTRDRQVVVVKND